MKKNINFFSSYLFIGCVILIIWIILMVIENIIINMDISKDLLVHFQDICKKDNSQDDKCKLKKNIDLIEKNRKDIKNYNNIIFYTVVLNIFFYSPPFNSPNSMFKIKKNKIRYQYFLTVILLFIIGLLTYYVVNYFIKNNELIKELNLNKKLSQKIKSNLSPKDKNNSNELLKSINEYDKHINKLLTYSYVNLSFLCVLLFLFLILIVKLIRHHKK